MTKPLGAVLIVTCVLLLVEVCVRLWKASSLCDPASRSVDDVIVLEDYMKIARSGDVIVFSGSKRDSCTVRIISDSSWSHVGIYVASYIMHADTPGGVRMDKFLEYIGDRPDDIVCVRRYMGPRISDDDIMKRIDETYGKPFNYGEQRLFQTVFGTCPISDMLQCFDAPPREGGYVCSEYASETLREFKVQLGGRLYRKRDRQIKPEDFLLGGSLPTHSAAKFICHGYGKKNLNSLVNL
jgi:hypothetical protein